MINKSFKTSVIIATFLFSIIGFYSCEKELITKDDNKVQESEITVEDGYLNFTSNQSLIDYISNIEAQLDNSLEGLKSANNISIPDGFQSLSNKLYQVENKIKSGNIVENTEAFYAELDRALIPEDVIHYVVDTARRLKLNGKIYQITEAGTFIYTNELFETFDNLYTDFLDVYKNYDNQIDSITYMYGAIKFIDSYDYVSKGNLSVENIFALITGEEQKETTALNLKSSNSKIVSSYTSKYNLSNYRVGGGTKVGQGFSSIGLNNWRSKNFDSDHRVNVNLYALNYGFFKCSGFKAKFQYKHKVKANVGIGRWRRWITIASYWLTTNAPEMVIGIDYFKGCTSFNYNLKPSDYAAISSSFSNNYGSVATNMVFKGFLKEPENLLKDWVSNIHVFGASIDILGTTYRDTDAFKALYDQGYDYITNQFKTRTSTFVKNNLKSSTAPVLLLSPGVVGLNGSKEYMYLNGVTSYNNHSEKKIRLGFPSGGASWNSNSKYSVTPYQPISFKVETAYIFGAVKYNGVWKGVRMYID